MSLEFLLALSQGNVVHPNSTTAPLSSRTQPAEAVNPDDDSNVVHNLRRPSTPPRRPASAPPRRRPSPSPSSTARAWPSSLRPSSNLVEPLPPIDPLIDLDSQQSQRTSTRRARLLLRQQLARGEEAEVSQAEAAAEPVDAAGRSEAVRRAQKRARRRKEWPDRDRARYLVNVGYIYRHLPSLLSLLHHRLMRREYASAAQLLSVLFRVRRLDSESVLKATTQLLPLASTTPLADMIRLYRRYLFYKAASTRKGRFPPVLVKNAAQVVMELPLMLLKQGLRQNAYDALAAYATQQPFDSVPVFHGYLGAIAVLLGMEARQQVDEWRGAGGADVSDLPDDEDDAPVSFSLSHFTQSQASQQPTVYSTFSSSALVTAQQRLQVQSAASLRHLQQALTLQPDSDAWLYYAVESLTKLTPSHSSVQRAMQLVHRFTIANPLHPTGWRLKLDLLLTHFPAYSSSILTSALHLLFIDPVHPTSLAILAFFHSRGWVASDTLLRAAARSLDVDADERSHCWKWLHAALHAVQRGDAGLTWKLVGAEEEKRRDGREDEWEVAELLAELQVTENEEAGAPQQRPDDGKEREEKALAGARHKRKAALKAEAAKRRRTGEAATPPSSSASPSTPLSAASGASPTPRAASSLWLSLTSSVEESGAPRRFDLFPSRRPLSAELRGRVEWWMLSGAHLAGVRPLSTGRRCPGEDGEVRDVKRCCLTLLLATIGGSEGG